MQETTKYLI